LADHRRYTLADHAWYSLADHRWYIIARLMTRGKPAPDVYLEAARLLGLQPERCVCLEDSGNGILAGAAAGMQVIAVPDPRFPPQPAALAQARVVLRSLTELDLALLRGL
jgi:beta-phosphoglucomutase-like phosphatase (HAD superfamily)